MPSAASLTSMRADLDSLRAWLDAMAAAGGPRLVVPVQRAAEPAERSPLPGAAVTTRATAGVIAWGLELPALARRRFRGDSGCVLADVGKKPRAGVGAATRHPVAKAAALWQADLADDRAWRHEYESRAWGYAALRWLLIDQCATGRGERPVPGSRAGARDAADVARLRAATADAAVHRDAGQARRALVSRLSADAHRLLRGRPGARQSRDLLAASAEATLLAGLLTYACWPSSALAQAYLVQALALTQACQDKQLGVAVLCAMSHQAAFNGRLDEAGKLVSTALSGSSGDAAPQLAARLRLLSARDRLYRGDLTSGVRAIKEAARELDRALPGAKPSWTQWFNESDLLLFAAVLASAHAVAGLPDAAHDITVTARRLTEHARFPCTAGLAGEAAGSAPGGAPTSAGAPLAACSRPA